MKNLIKPIFILTSLYALVGCTNPSLFNHDYVDVNFQDGNKTKTIRFEIGAKFGDLFNESPKRGCILTHFEDEKGNSYSLDDKIELTEDKKYKAIYTVDRESITEINDKILEKRGDLRIMSFNVLSDDWNNKPQMHGYDSHNEKYQDGIDDGRDIQAWDTLQTFKPDVIGVQEFDDEWYSAFKKFKNNADSISYTAVNENEIKYALNGNQQTIYTTLLYNPETVTLKEWKHTRFKTADTNTNCRSYTYGVFERIENNEEFIVISSHWNHLDSSLDGTIQKDKEQAEETAEVYKSLSNGYGCPVIAVGDMNQIDSHHSYKTLVNESEFIDLKYETQERGLVCDTYHIGNGKSYEPDKWYRGIDSLIDSLVSTDEARDHILGNDRVESLYYETVTTERALDSSDHMPIFVDVNLK